MTRAGTEGDRAARTREAAADDSEDPRVCFCMRVHRRALLDAVRGGARTVESLQAATGAGTGCGTCRIDLLALLEEDPT